MQVKIIPIAWARRFECAGAASAPQLVGNNL
jgi:hypothetical protein